MRGSAGWLWCKLGAACVVFRRFPSFRVLFRMLWDMFSGASAPSFGN